MSRKLQHIASEYFATVRASELKVDRSYQRTLDEKRALKIGESYDPERIGTITVSERADGDLYVIDGQHRVTGLVLAGHGDMLVAVSVKRNLTVVEEARLFYQLNGKDGVVHTRAFDNFRARVVAEEPIALAITSIIEEHGLHVVPSACKNGIAAVEAVQAVHKQYNNLSLVLGVLKKWAKAFDGDPYAYESRLIRNVGAFLATYPSADADVLAHKLYQFGRPQKMISLIAIEQKSAKHLPAKFVAVSVLLQTYNTRNRKRLTMEDRAERPSRSTG